MFYSSITKEQKVRLIKLADLYHYYGEKPFLRGSDKQIRVLKEMLNMSDFMTVHEFIKFGYNYDEIIDCGMDA